MAKLLGAWSIDLYLIDMPDVAFITPPVGGTYDLVVSDALRGSERAFWTLHEVGHVIAGDTDERMRQETYDPYPPWERQADVFAALGVLPVKDRTGDVEWITLRLLQLVPTDHIAWTKYRAPATAAAVAELLAEGLE